MFTGNTAKHSTGPNSQPPARAGLPAATPPLSNDDIMAAILASPSPLPAPTKSFHFPQDGEIIRSPNNGMRTYTLGHQLGAGNFGIVYAAEDNWGNELAIKVFRASRTYEEVRAAARDEAAKLLSLRHPQITYVHDAFEHNNGFYIVSERCGAPVSTLLDPAYTGSIWIRPIARCMFQALGYIHDNGYVHQDIHLNKVFISWAKNELLPDQPRNLSFKVGDLGLAKPVKLIDPQNTVLADWMLPPEYLDGASFGVMDHRVDVYHSALLLLQVLTGQHLKLTRADVVAGVPRQMAEQLGSIGNVLSYGLRRHVDHRPRTALEFWEALKVVAP